MYKQQLSDVNLGKKIEQEIYDDAYIRVIWTGLDANENIGYECTKGCAETTAIDGMTAYPKTVGTFSELVKDGTGTVTSKN